jgi:hypothetical protein
MKTVPSTKQIKMSQTAHIINKILLIIIITEFKTTFILVTITNYFIVSSVKQSFPFAKNLRKMKYRVLPLHKEHIG